MVVFLNVALLLTSVLYQRITWLCDCAARSTTASPAVATTSLGHSDRLTPEDDSGHTTASKVTVKNVNSALLCPVSKAVADPAIGGPGGRLPLIGLRFAHLLFKMNGI